MATPLSTHSANAVPKFKAAYRIIRTWLTQLLAQLKPIDAQLRRRTRLQRRGRTWRTLKAPTCLFPRKTYLPLPMLFLLCVMALLIAHGSASRLGPSGPPWMGFAALDEKSSVDKHSGGKVKLDATTRSDPYPPLVSSLLFPFLHERAKNRARCPRLTAAT